VQLHRINHLCSEAHIPIPTTYECPIETECRAMMLALLVLTNEPCKVRGLFPFIITIDYLVTPTGKRLHIVINSVAYFFRHSGSFH